MERGEVRRGRRKEGKEEAWDQNGDLHQHHPDYSTEAHFEH